MIEKISLDRLYAFECAARHLSFRDAAKELCVSPAAVGQRVRALEDELNMQLFVRQTRAIALTSEGETLLPHLQSGLASIDLGLRKLRIASAKPTLTVTTTATFAECFLLVHLSAFQKELPDLSVRVLTSEELVDLQSGDAQVAVRFGRGVYPGCTAVPLFDDAYIAVASPDLAKNRSDDAHWFRRHTHITTRWPHDPASAPSWSEWYSQSGISEPTAPNTLTVNIESHALRAAINGQGIALTHEIHAREAMHFGQLIAIGPPTRLRPRFRYWLVQANDQTGPAVEQFGVWLGFVSDADRVSKQKPI